MISDFEKTLSDLRAETLLLLGDPSGDRYDAGRIDEALNDAALEYALETRTVTDELDVQILDNVYEYDIKTRCEEEGNKGFAFPVRVGWDGRDAAALAPVTTHSLDRRGYSFNRDGYPAGLVLDQLSQGRIHIFPIPNADGESLPSTDYNLQVLYVGMPDYMSDDADNPDSLIQAYFHHGLPYGAASRLLDESEDFGDQDRAEEYSDHFWSYIRETNKHVSMGSTQYQDATPL
tara:strand:+ start:94 stop:792 length:699 start_codon:yes stop_codon:yes gene_type:complete